MEALECRRLLSATVSHPVGLTQVPEDTPTTVDLSNTITDPQFTGTVVQFQTSLGTFDAQLYDQAAPQTVANFLQYVNLGLYDGTIIHRVVNMPSTDPTQQLQVIQGGGFYANGDPVQTFPPVPNEFGIPNTAGTLAMAKPAGDPNGATSQWFVNTASNPALDDPANAGGFTVFGQIFSGLSVAQAINALPTADGSALNPQLDASVPVLTPLPAGTSVPPATDLVQLNVAVLPKITFSATSDNLQLVNPTISGTQLMLNPAPGRSGFCHVTVTGVDLLGNKVTDTILVEVGAVPGRTIDVPLGGGHPRTVTFHQQGLSHGVITLSGPGSAVVQFTGDAMHLTQSGGWNLAGDNIQAMTIQATGTTTATTLSTRGRNGRNAYFIGPVTTDGAFKSVRMKNAIQLGGISAPGGIGSINIDYAENGTIQSGAAVGRAPVQVRNISWQDESLSSAAPIGRIVTYNWANSDSASEFVQAPYVRSILSRGNFTPGLQLSGSGAPRGRAIGSLSIHGAIGGTWNFPGSLTSLTVGGTSSDFNGTFNTPLRAFNVRGDFSGTLTAPSIGAIHVRGFMQKASLNFTAPLAAGARDLGLLAVRGPITESSIQSAGSIGEISGSELSFSSVYAGVASLPAGQVLPQTAADFPVAAGIARIDLHPKKKEVGFVTSVVAAAVIGDLSFGTITLTNGAQPFGVAAHTIHRLSARDNAGKQNLDFQNLTSQDQFNAAVASKKLNLSDFKVVLV